MARSVGNLAIIISGNAKPLMGALASAKSHVSQFQNSANRILTGRALPRGGSGLLGRHPLVQPPKAEHLAPSRSAINAAGLRYQSFGRFAQSLFIKGFGGGIVGGLIGVLGFGFLQSLMGWATTAARTLTELIEEGMDLSRFQISLKFLAQDQQRSSQWFKQILELSSGSGYGLTQIGSAFQTIAGQVDELDQVPPIMRAITEISSGLGADAAKMQRFALAVGQIAAAGRFEGQEILQITETLPIKHFAETAGVSVGEFRRQMKEGTLSVQILWETLNRLALSPGGAFFGKMNANAKEALGQMMRVRQGLELVRGTMGQAFLEELKDQNVLNALTAGFEWLLAHQGEVRKFFKDLVEVGKELAVVSASFAGVIYDITTFILKNRSWLFPVLGALAGAAAGSVFGPIGTGAGAILGLGAGIGLNQTIEGNAPFGKSSGEWSKAMREFLNQTVPTRMQSEIDKIRFPARLSADIEKMASGISTAFRDGGGSAFAEFNMKMRQIAEAEAFFPGDQQRKIDAAIRERDHVERLRKMALDQGDFVEMNRLIDQKNAAEEKIANLEAMRIPFGAAEAGFGRAQAFLELEKTLTSIKRAADEMPKAMERGSVEAASTINKSLATTPQVSIQQRVLKVLEQAKKIEEDQKKLLAEISKQLKPRPSIFGVKL